MALLIWECSDRTGEPIRIHADDQTPTNAVALPESLIEKISTHLDAHSIRVSSFDAMNANWLLKAQFEHLAMGLEYVWKIAEVSFCDSTLPSSHERKGGIRYAKSLAFSRNACAIHIAVLDNQNAYLKTLLTWIGVAGYSADAVVEEKIVRLLTLFSEDMILQIRTSPPYRYKQSGIYEILNEGEEIVQYIAKNEKEEPEEEESAMEVPDGAESATEESDGEENAKEKYEEKVGPTRVLSSLLADNLNYYLSNQLNDIGVVKRSEQSSQVELSNYTKMLQTYSRLVAIKDSITFSADDDLPHSSDPTDSMEQIDKEEFSRNILYYGIPGCGKSHRIKEKYCKEPCHYERIVFHPDYTYSDFVGQILPDCHNHNVEYKFIPGPFTRILKKAHADPDSNYYLIIEELNRGNAPAIFGDIFQLLDRAKEKDLKDHPELQLGDSAYTINNKEIAEEVYGNPEHPVRLPHNLYVMATMNTSDQNVFTLDTAFKRRWRMQNVKSELTKELEELKIASTETTWGGFLGIINEQIARLASEGLAGEDKRLGAYFADAVDMGSEERFAEKVLMYLWTDVFKNCPDRVFKPGYRTLEELIDGFKTVGFEVFKPEMGFPTAPLQVPTATLATGVQETDA